MTNLKIDLDLKHQFIFIFLVSIKQISFIQNKKVFLLWICCLDSLLQSAILRVYAAPATSYGHADASASTGNCCGLFRVELKVLIPT